MRIGYAKGISMLKSDDANKDEYCAGNFLQIKKAAGESGKKVKQQEL